MSTLYKPKAPVIGSCFGMPEADRLGGVLDTNLREKARQLRVIEEKTRGWLSFKYNTRGLDIVCLRCRGLLSFDHEATAAEIEAAIFQHRCTAKAAA